MSLEYSATLKLRWATQMVPTILAQAVPAPMATQSEPPLTQATAGAKENTPDGWVATYQAGRLAVAAARADGEGPEAPQAKMTAPQAAAQGWTVPTRSLARVRPTAHPLCPSRFCGPILTARPGDRGPSLSRGPMALGAPQADQARPAGSYTLGGAPPLFRAHNNAYRSTHRGGANYPHN